MVHLYHHAVFVEWIVVKVYVPVCGGQVHLAVLEVEMHLMPGYLIVVDAVNLLD